VILDHSPHGIENGFRALFLPEGDVPRTIILVETAVVLEKKIKPQITQIDTDDE
jgi:hypothetical protein